MKRSITDRDVGLLEQHLEIHRGGGVVVLVEPHQALSQLGLEDIHVFLGKVDLVLHRVDGVFDLSHPDLGCVVLLSQFVEFFLELRILAVGSVQLGLLLCQPLF